MHVLVRSGWTRADAGWELSGRRVWEGWTFTVLVPTRPVYLLQCTLGVGVTLQVNFVTLFYDIKFSNCLTGSWHLMCQIINYISCGEWLICAFIVLFVFCVHFCILCLILFTVPLVRSWCYWDAVYLVFYFFLLFLLCTLCTIS